MNAEKFLRRRAEGNLIQQRKSLACQKHFDCSAFDQRARFWVGEIMAKPCWFERSAVKKPPDAKSGTSLSMSSYFHLGLKERQLGNLLILQALAATVWCQ